MTLLVHICCAHCLLAVLDPLRSQGHALRGLFYNPNIQPFIEFRRRLKAVKVLAESLDIEIDYDETYPLDEFLGRVAGTGARRCEICYRDRLTTTARHARAAGCEAFTTTLLTSVHQKHDLVRRIGEEAAAAEGVRFLYTDWRDRAEAAHNEARRRHLYLQQYCGCIYSEHERFKDTSTHVYRGPGGEPARTPRGETG